MDIGSVGADNSRMPSVEKEALTMEPWAVGIGLATLLVVGCVALFAAWDRTHTGQLEQVITNTAVGDTHLVTEPPSGKGPVASTTATKRPWSRNSIHA